jgi:NTP pyrophosphatase (non-canonical NTP hydrolase)
MTNKEDKLDIIFQKQIELQERLGNIYKINSSDSMKQKFINQMILAIQEEAIEIMRESAYKNPDYVEFGWKKGQTSDNEKFKDEIADLLHFLVNLCIVSDMDAEELFNRFYYKNKENHERQDNNY